MKLTQQQAIEALAQVGVKGVVIVENDDDSTFNQDELFEKVDSERGKIILSRERNAIKTEVEKSIAGKVGANVEKMLKNKLGVDKSIFTPDMKDEEKLEVALEEYLKSKPDAEKDFNAKLKEIIATKDAEKVAEIEAREKTINELRDNFTKKEMREYYRALVDKEPILEGADKELYVDLAMSKLQEKYIAKYKDGKVEYYDKNNPENLAIVGNNKIVDDGEEIKGLLTRAGALQKDMRAVNPKDLADKGQVPTPPKPEVPKTRAIQNIEKFLANNTTE